MDMPKGSSSVQKKAEPLTGESLFDSVMTPLPPLPKLGDDLAAESASLAQADKTNEKKEEKKEVKNEEKKVESKPAEVKAAEKTEVKVEEKKEDTPEEKARKEAVALQKT